MKRAADGCPSATVACATGVVTPPERVRSAPALSAQRSGPEREARAQALAGSAPPGDRMLTDVVRCQ